MNAIAEKRMIATRTRLIIDRSAFFGTLAMKLGLKEEDVVIETAAVDADNIYYNSNYILQLTKDEAEFLLAHEVLHIALGHNWRQGDRDHDLWNMDFDYSINVILLKAGFTMPKGGLYDAAYDGKSPEARNPAPPLRLLLAADVCKRCESSQNSWVPTRLGPAVRHVSSDVSCRTCRKFFALESRLSSFPDHRRQDRGAENRYDHDQR